MRKPQLLLLRLRQRTVKTITLLSITMLKLTRAQLWLRSHRLLPGLVARLSVAPRHLRKQVRATAWKLGAAWHGQAVQV